jgi:excisionase family DNA binding protein
MGAYTKFFRPQKSAEVSPLSLRPRDAAAALGVSVKTLERWTAAGLIESHLVGRCRLYETSTLESFLASRRVAGQEVTT